MNSSPLAGWVHVDRHGYEWRADPDTPIDAMHLKNDDTGLSLPFNQVIDFHGYGDAAGERYLRAYRVDD